MGLCASKPERRKATSKANRLTIVVRRARERGARRGVSSRIQIAILSASRVARSIPLNRHILQSNIPANCNERTLPRLDTAPCHPTSPIGPSKRAVGSVSSEAKQTFCRARAARSALWATGCCGSPPAPPRGGSPRTRPSRVRLPTERPWPGPLPVSRSFVAPVSWACPRLAKNSGRLARLLAFGSRAPSAGCPTNMGTPAARGRPAITGAQAPSLFVPNRGICFKKQPLDFFRSRKKHLHNHAP